MKAVCPTAQVQLSLIRGRLHVLQTTKNPELANTEPLLPGEIRCSVPARLSHNIFVNYSVYNFMLQVFLFEDTLFTIYCWFINTESVVNSTTSCLNEACLTQTFSIRLVTAFLHFGTLESFAAPHVRAPLNSEITNKMQKQNITHDTK